MFFDSSSDHERREREEAAILRRSRWWQNKLAQAQCFYCKTPLKRSMATMDHLLPIARGGRSTKSNVVIACKACNTRKKDQTAAEFVATECEA